MGRKSSIARLPSEVRAEIDRMIRDGSMTIDEMVEEIRSLGPEAETVSRSSVGRYKKRMDEVGKRMREAREVSRVWVQELGSEPESDMAQLLVQLLNTVAMNVAIGEMESDETTAKDLHYIASAVKNMETARKTWVDREAKVREMVKAEALEVVKEVGGGGVITDETIEEIEKRFKLK